MDEVHNIYYTWQGKNYNIPDYLSNPKTISTFMLQISKECIFASSLKQYEYFCNESLYRDNYQCFSSFFLYTLNNIIVGFLNVRVTYADAEIDFMCVDRQYLRKNIAQKTYSFFEQILVKQNSIFSIFLEVSVNNFPAISLYEKIGFKKFSIRKKYYKNEDDAWVMKKELGEI